MSQFTYLNWEGRSYSGFWRDLTWLQGQYKSQVWVRGYDVGVQFLDYDPAFGLPTTLTYLRHGARAPQPITPDDARFPGGRWTLYPNLCEWVFWCIECQGIDILEPEAEAFFVLCGEDALDRLRMLKIMQP